MDYEIITVPGTFGLENLPDTPDSEHVVITREDGSQESFPVDESNPRYVQFLEEIS